LDERKIFKEGGGRRHRKGLPGQRKPKLKLRGRTSLLGQGLKKGSRRLGAYGSDSVEVLGGARTGEEENLQKTGTSVSIEKGYKFVERGEKEKK